MANLDRYVMYREAYKSEKALAIRYAMNNDIGFIKSDKGDVTVVPPPQRAGTIAQRHAYEEVTVKRLLEDPVKKVPESFEDEEGESNFSIDTEGRINNSLCFRVMSVNGSKSRKDNFSYADITFAMERKAKLEKIFTSTVFVIIVD